MGHGPYEAGKGALPAVLVIGSRPIEMVAEHAPSFVVLRPKDLFNWARNLILRSYRDSLVRMVETTLLDSISPSL